MADWADDLAILIINEARDPDLRSEVRRLVAMRLRIVRAEGVLEGLYNGAAAAGVPKEALPCVPTRASPAR